MNRTSTQRNGHPLGASPRAIHLVQTIVALGPVLAAFALCADPVPVLLVTGQDHPAHPWRQTAPVLRHILEADARLQVRITEDPQHLAAPGLERYRLVVLHFMNWEQPGPGPEARENLRRFVERGGGLAGVHFACGAWHGEWPAFVELLGRVWHGSGPGRSQHDPRGPFTVEITDPHHPVTRGLTNFVTDDELYTCLEGTPPIRVLAQATSRVDGRSHPMAWVRHYGAGRVFFTTLGHDVPALTNALVPQLLRQGCQWAAGLPPP